jgi:ABC-type hemin transport system substrate-binding protein
LDKVMGLVFGVQVKLGWEFTVTPKAQLVELALWARALLEKVCAVLAIVLMVGLSVSTTGRETEAQVVVETVGGLKVAKEKACVGGQKTQTTEELLA